MVKSLLDQFISFQTLFHAIKTGNMHMWVDQLVKTVCLISEFESPSPQARVVQIIDLLNSKTVNLSFRLIRNGKRNYPVICFLFVTSDSNSGSIVVREGRELVGIERSPRSIGMIVFHHCSKASCTNNFPSLFCIFFFLVYLPQFVQIL